MYTPLKDFFKLGLHVHLYIAKPMWPRSTSFMKVKYQIHLDINLMPLEGFTTFALLAEGHGHP
jgi:hypothetical protein